jgi:type III pantothenate kinase
MLNNLVIDVGNTMIKAGYFEQDVLVDTFSCQSKSLLKNEWKDFLQKRQVEHTLVASVHTKAELELRAILTENNLSYDLLDIQQLSLILDVDEPENVGHDRIANLYGALHHFPQNDCIIVDIGTAVTFDFVTKEGCYKGGAIYPGFEISAKGLSEYTDRLPFVSVQRPDSPLGRTTLAHIQSGLYYGLLGTVERIIFELKQQTTSPSSVQVLATGGTIQSDQLSSCHTKVSFISDLKELVDFIDPYLTLIGLNEILKEFIHKKKEK